MSEHTHAGLVHQALLYDGTDDFVAELLPFAREGVERGERVFAVAAATNIAALREALGDHAAGVELLDASEWYGTPGRTLRAYGDYVDAHGAERRVRVIGEPVWDGRSDAAIREWARYESVINVAFADSPATIVCPYDLSSLPDSVLEHAVRTHPELFDARTPSPSDRYRAPEAFFGDLDDAPLEAPVGLVTSIPLDLDLSVLRRLLGEEATAVGLPPERLGDFVLAAHEVAANALRHGGRRAVARLWSDDGDVICEVEDDGRGLADPLAGHVRPAPGQMSGYGLWLARQLCDLVEVRSGAGGTTVRLRVAR